MAKAPPVIEQIGIPGLIPINEVFETLQGEAAYTGTPALFIRLQGCPVSCPWCDTPHTWDLRAADEVPEADMMAKDGAASTPIHARLTVERVAALVADHEAGHVVITGGEPCIHDLTALCQAIEATGRTVQIETSGTHEVRVSDTAWVTVSPKIGMPGGLTIRPDAVARANEIKMPVGKPDDVDTLLAFLAEHGVTRGKAAPLVWLQPLSRSPKATALCIAAATTLGFRVSIQTHAFIGVR